MVVTSTLATILTGKRPIYTIGYYIAWRLSFLPIADLYT